MNGNEGDVIPKLSNIVDQLLSGKRKIKNELDNIDGIEDEELKSLAGKIVSLAEQYAECYGFIVDLSYGRLFTEPPRSNALANPFKQLHAELRHLTWQIQEIANGDYDQSVSFSGDFSDAINKMIIELRERQALSDQIKEDENLFRSIFSTSPDGIVLCDLNHYIINASNAAYRMLQITDGDNKKMQFDELIHPDDFVVFGQFIDSLVAGGSGAAFAELRVVPHNSSMSFWSEQNASLLLDSNSVPKGYIIIIRDISERKAAEAQLLQYTDELDESNKTKNRMFSIISHDLKSPFSALLGTSDMMVKEAEKDDANIERIKKYSKIIHESANRTFGLLVNLLDWSRMQSDRIVVKPEHLNLNDVIIENMDIAHTAVMNKNITLSYTTPGNYPIISDRAIINTILRNLISNAIKYTPQDGNISISLMQDDNMCMISVKDSGVGIPADKLEMIFKSDNVQSTPGTADEKGTGLGLLLCRDFVYKIGGDIWAKSVYGQGATFSFTIGNLDIV